MSTYGTGRAFIDIPFKSREFKIIIGWKEEVFWPDEARVLKKLRRALPQSGDIRLSRMQIQIVHGWAEERLGGHYGGGEVANAEEMGILEKLRLALAQ